MAPVSMVVVRLDIAAVDLVRVVDGVVEGDDLRVVCAVVVVEVVDAGVIAIDAGVDDSDY